MSGKDLREESLIEELILKKFKNKYQKRLNVVF